MPEWSPWRNRGGEKNHARRQLLPQQFLCGNPSGPGVARHLRRFGRPCQAETFPALYQLFRRGLLHEDSRIVGCARTSYSDDGFRDHLRPFLTAGTDEQRNAFLTKIHYIAGDYPDLDFYRRLDRFLDKLEAKSDLPANRTFYLAMPASLYPAIIDKLSETGMLAEGDGEDAPWRHVVLEKPFGRDFESAEALDRDLHSHMREDQIYRIDHYLGKDTVQNILMLRFANLIFEPIWNSQYIDSVQLTVSETLGVEGRAGYYEQAGLLARHVPEPHARNALPGRHGDARQLLPRRRARRKGQAHQIDPARSTSRSSTGS